MMTGVPLTCTKRDRETLRQGRYSDSSQSKVKSQPGRASRLNNVMAYLYQLTRVGIAVRSMEPRGSGDEGGGDQHHPRRPSFRLGLASPCSPKRAAADELSQVSVVLQGEVL